MTFLDAQGRLLKEIKSQVLNGHVTERRMARLIGVSQPHMHNVLKGARILSPRITDKLLKLFHMSVLDLSSLEELQDRVIGSRHRTLSLELNVLREPIGTNTLWKNEVFTRERLPMPVPVLRSGNARLVAARVQPDLRMTGVLGQADLVLVNTTAPTPPIDPAGLYVVQTVSGTAVRYLRQGAAHLYLATEDALDSPWEWERAPLADWSSIVHARLLWIGKEKDLRLPAHRRGRVLVTTS